MALRLIRADGLELALGRGLGEEVVHPGLGGDGRCGRGIVSRYHDGTYSHAPQVGELLGNALLDDVAKLYHTQDAVVLRHDERSRPFWATCCTASLHSSESPPIPAAER